jgi:hypothetical protein
MQLFNAVRPQVVSEFKTALIYLEQWELLDPGGHYDIPISGRIRSPGLDIKTRGSLGYLFDWFLRPNKNKEQLSIASINIQLGIRRRTSLVSLYRFEYSGEDLVDSISTDQFFTRNPSERRDRDCWSIYVRGYLERRRQERVLYPPEVHYFVRCPSDTEVATILLSAATFITH